MAGGTSVTLTGTSLTGTTSVTFDGTAGSVTNVTATSLTVATPAHAAGAVNIVLTAPGGSITSTGGFTYVAVPTVTVPSIPELILKAAVGQPISLGTPPLLRVASDIEIAVSGKTMTLAVQSSMLVNSARIASYQVVIRPVNGASAITKTITVRAKGSIGIRKFTNLAVGAYRIGIIATNTNGKRLAKWTSPIVRITG